MASATKAGFGDTPLSFNPGCATSLQGTLGRMLSEAGSGPSSSVKEEDDPPGIWMPLRGEGSCGGGGAPPEPGLGRLGPAPAFGGMMTVAL